jgi:ribosomal protein L37AE/L43A
MRIPKRYGEYRVDNCPFCGKLGVVRNPQGIPVCNKHKNKELDNVKCACGAWLEVRDGKFGSYFFCHKCGNISFKKAIEMNPQIKEAKTEENKREIKEKNTKEIKKEVRKEITVSSEDLDYLY